MLMKKSRYLSSKDVATICDVYTEIRLDFAKEEVLPMLLGTNGKSLRSVNINGEICWGQVDQKRLSRIVDSLVSNCGIGSKWSADGLLNKLINILLKNKVSGVEDVKPEIIEFVEDICEKPSIEYEIYMPIYGVSLAKGSCLTVGKYSLCT